MTVFALALVLSAALAHATWNLLLKRSGMALIYTWNITVAGTIVTLPIALYELFNATVTLTGWFFFVGTSVIHAFYFILLALAYEHGDMSLVYPLARGMGVALTPIGAVLILGEHISLFQGIGIAGIVVGLLILQIPADFSRETLATHFRPAAGLIFAVVTGITIATYSLWDKVGVSHVPPLLYVTGAFLGPAISMSWLFRRRVGMLIAEWRAHPVTMGAVAVLSPLAYSLALVALSIAQVSQVAPLRELGVVIGTVLGITLLREPSPGPRIGGAIVIALGAIVLAYSSVAV
jgi:drug/metabolite transporter (DMT)-like permease